MIGWVQITLLIVLAALVAIRIAMARHRRLESLCRTKFDHFLQTADSILARTVASEAAAMVYRARVMVEIARDDAQKIAAIRLFLGALESLDIEESEKDRLAHTGYAAISLIHKLNRARGNFLVALLLKKSPDLTEKGIAAARAQLLKDFFARYINQPA